MRPAVAFVAAAALSLVPIQPAIAGPPSILPQGGSVAAGHATIGAASNNSLTVNQGSQNAVLNWNSFSIGQPNTVTYHQPNAASATLNRVTGNTPSSIAGRLNANGQIYLVNPNGVAITKTGAVKVSGGFVGSTLGTDDGDFMNGKRTFKGNGHSASVSNAGSITVGKGGFVGLIGGTVSNSGTIRVPLGKVGLGSGESVTLDVNGDGFMQVAVPTASKAAAGKGLVDVSGRISAAGGTIELQAATLKQAIRNAVNVSGTLSAHSLSGHSGSIVLGGGAGGAVNVSGRLNVSAGRSVAYAASVKSVAAVRNASVAGRKAAAAKPALAPANGGTIAITGANVAIADKASLKARSQGTKGGAIGVTGDALSIGAATLDASGATAGGTILIGGGPQGKGPLAHAQTVSIAPGAALIANATQNGNGGQIVAWSDAATSVYGLVSAIGAGLGDGGKIETSGHVLDVAGVRVNASAPNGVAGIWLLDPFNLTVSGAATTATSSGTNPITYTSNSGGTIVRNTTINSALNAGTSVILTTSGTSGDGHGNGDITISSAIAKTAGGAASLTMNAQGSIIINAAISSTVGAMAVTLNADSGGYTAGGYVNIQSPITTLGGALVIGGQGAPLTSAAVGNSTQAVGVKIGAGLTTTGGAITINGSGFVSSTSTAYGVYINNNAVNAGGGNVSITGIGGGNGSSSNNVGVLTSGGLGTVSTSGVGRISITGTGGNSSGAGNYGINQTAPITNTGTGAITLSGTGGGTGASEIGYLSNSNTTAGTGNISITGIASATATGSGTHGISFSGATISTTGAGAITLAGTATGTGAGANTDAVFVGAAGVITAAGGLISVTGHNNSTGTGGGNDGVYVTGGGSTIKSIGTGGVTVLGFGGGSGAGGSNYGVVWDVANGIQSTGGGAVSITGTGGDTGGSGAGNNGVNTAMALASAGGAINITGSAGTSSGTNYGINIASVAAGAGVITLSSTSVNNAAAALTGASLNLLGAGGVYALTNPGNAVTTLAGNTGAVTYSQLGALTIGTVGISAGLTTTGTPWVTTGGALTIASGATVSGAAPILAATGAFINSSGSGAVVANPGRWLVYSANSTGDTFGNLNSNNAAVWNTPANGAVVPTGNRYVFANQPTATFTSVSLGKVYGVNDTAAVAASYTVTGLQSVTNAYTDTLATVTTGTASVTSAGSLATATLAGSPYAITAAAGTLASTNGYALAFASLGVLTVTAAPLTVTANAQTRPYGAANPTLTYVAAGLVNGDTLTGALATTATATSSVLGSPYAITQGTLAASPNYALTYVGANLTVTAAPLTVTANPQSRAYGAANPTLTYAAAGLVNGDTLTGALATTATATSSVLGSPYAITQGTLAASPNYALTYVGANLTVTAAPLTVTANAQARPYGAANPTLTYAAAGLVNGDTLTGALATTATATSSVLGSPYAITQGTLAASPNYALTYVGANLTVTAAPLTVTANNETKTYGATFAFAGTEFTSTGLQNGETIGSVTLTSAGSAPAASVAGSPYAIVASAAAGGTFTASNYAIGYVNGAMTVTPAGLTVTANAQARPYGAANPTLTYAAAGLVNGDTLTGALATTATATSSVLGSPYAITQGTLAASPNYALTYVGANLTVTAAPLTVTANNETKTYGATFAFAGTEFTSTGLQNGETIGSVTLTSAGSAPAASVAGSPYAIVASAAAGGTFTASNYAIGYVNGAMTVTPAATDGDGQCAGAGLWRGQSDADLCRDRPGQRRHADRRARHHGDRDLLGPRIALRHHPGHARPPRRTMR